MRRLAVQTVVIVMIAFTSAPALRADSGERFLHDYKNDDSSRPDGSDSKRDDSSAMKKALADGPGVVRVGRGSYRLGDIRIPGNVTVQGQGKATIIRSNGAASIFRQVNVAAWALKDLVLDGEAAGEWQKRKDAGTSGLFTERCRSFEVSGVTARNNVAPRLQLRPSVCDASERPALDLGRQESRNAGNAWPFDDKTSSCLPAFLISSPGDRSSATRVHWNA
jgi:hypothetical protein